jgi:MSHA pilin protein MshD
MNTGQMMLTLGAVILLSTLVLRVNSSQLVTQDSMQNTKFGILAISLATSVIEEASETAFDEATTENFVSSLTSLTNTNSFGPESGEVFDTFDDFDDFHNFANTDSTMPSAIFDVSCLVTYVNPSDPNFICVTNSWHKMITVTVSSVSMKDTVKMSKVFSYWKLP